MAAKGLRRFAAPLFRPATKLLLPRGLTAQAPTTHQESFYNVPETQVTTLKNGLTVATEDSGISTATVGLWIDAGSRVETKQTNGVSNFLAGMAFKGTTKKRMQLVEEIFNVGGRLNAYTLREQTAYYAKVLSKDLPKAVDLLSDIVLNSEFDSAEIERRRSVILREEKQEFDTQIDEVVFHHLHSIAYQGTPLGRPVLGLTENIKRISRQDLVDYISTHYTAPCMVLAGAGGVNHQELVSMAENSFAGLSSSPDTTPLTPCRYTGSSVTLRNDDWPYAHVAIAVEGVGWAHPDYFPLMIASELVGNWDPSLGRNAQFTSKLAKNAITDPGVHSFMSFNTCYTDTGLWGIYLVCDKMKIDNFIYNVQHEWNRISSLLTEAEVRTAKNCFKTTLFKQLNGSTPVCEDIGRQTLTYGRRIPLPELDYRIEQVDAKAVRKAVSKYVWDRCPAVVGIGPVEQMSGVSDYMRLRSSMSWKRL